MTFLIRLDLDHILNQQQINWDLISVEMLLKDLVEIDIG